MRVSNIKIKNLFGITETTVGSEPIEISGAKGTGKTSVLDAIRFALTNKSERDLIVRSGSEEGEILIEMESGLTIERKKRTQKSDYIRVQDGDFQVTRPAEFLSEIFTPLQLDPIAFTQMSKAEKNETILSLIDFKWSTNWIQEQFGELPQGIDYSKHIFEVLADIQSPNGDYYKKRQDINRDIKAANALIQSVQQKLPENYESEKWADVKMNTLYEELSFAKNHNENITRAKEFVANYAEKKQSITANMELEISQSTQAVNSERESIQEEIKALKSKLDNLDEKKNLQESHIKDKFKNEFNKLDEDTTVAKEWASKAIKNTEEMQAEITLADNMRSLIPEYNNMVSKEKEVKELTETVKALTTKIDKARTLPAEILKTATIPIKGMTVEEGIPLINGLPVSNLSDGELLELCVDITVHSPGKLQIILVDGAERLDTKSRETLYNRCKEKGLQLIATRVTDSDELEVMQL